MSKAIRTLFTFESDSKAGSFYQTLVYCDNTTSCDCKGWTRRVQPDGSRSCKHTRLIESGLADRMCQSRVDYDKPKAAPVPAGRQQQELPAITGRKFDLTI